MAGPEQIGGNESPEKKIPLHVVHEATVLEEFISHEPLSAEQILQDLGITDKNSLEARYFQDVITGLNAKMERLNTDAALAVKSFPPYFKDGDQMEMRRDGVRHQLTITSQGQEVIKFEIGKRNVLSSDQEIELAVYMKNLLIDEHAVDTTDDIDPQEFMNFATQDNTENDNSSEWGLFSFSEMYGGPEDKKGYLQSYVEDAKGPVPIQKTKNIHLAPEMQIQLQNKLISGKTVTIDTIFGDPKPFIVEITSPDGSITIAYLQSNGTYLDEKKQRPRIYTGSLVKNMTTFRELQQTIEEQQKKIYTKEELYPDIATRSPAFQNAVNSFFALFNEGVLQFETNSAGMRTYVDMTDTGYVLRYELNNTGFNRSYNQNLVMNLEGTMKYDPKTGMYSLDQGRFAQQLATQVEHIVKGNFYFIDKAAYGKGVSKETFTSVKKASDIRALNKKYSKQTRTGAVGLCSQATRETASTHFGLQIPQGNALNAINSEPTDPHYKAVEDLSGIVGITDIGTDKMYELLSQHLDKGCTVVDIGYISNTKNGRKYGYGHRNLAYYCYDSHERYVIDPVANYGGRGVTRKGIPIDELKTNIFLPKKMRYYAPDVGVYEKDA